MMNPYKLWKYKHWIAIAVLSFICMGQLAYTNHLAGELIQADQKQIDAVAQTIKPYEKAIAQAQSKANQASEKYEKLKSEQQVKTEVITREVQKIIDRPVYLNQCFDADGLSAINRLITDNSSQSK